MKGFVTIFSLTVLCWSVASADPLLGIDLDVSPIVKDVEVDLSDVGILLTNFMNNDYSDYINIFIKTGLAYGYGIEKYRSVYGILIPNSDRYMSAVARVAFCVLNTDYDVDICDKDFVSRYEKEQFDGDIRSASDIFSFYDAPNIQSQTAKYYESCIDCECYIDFVDDLINNISVELANLAAKGDDFDYYDLQLVCEYSVVYNAIEFESLQRGGGEKIISGSVYLLNRLLPLFGFNEVRESEIRKIYDQSKVEDSTPFLRDVCNRNTLLNSDCQ